MRAVAALLAILLATGGGAQAQDGGESAFVEVLRREDPASAERYVTLRDARSTAIAELERVKAQYGAVGAELRSVALPRLRQAQRDYAERTIALLEFLEARDRRLLATYQEEITRINKILEERARTREEMQRLLQGN